MTPFVVIKKATLDKSILNATHIVLNEAAILHTKLPRTAVAEFMRQGQDLILKLHNGATLVIENFLVVFHDEISDLVFEDDACVLYWFDGLSGFNEISGLEVLLPEPSKFTELLPWLIGVGVLGGAAIPLGLGGWSKSKSTTITVDPKGQMQISGKTAQVTVAETVRLTIMGQD
jgi:hypothetical protein